eukprot:m.249058 g.249058  ORF g.249058 m.249058 type:complete len:324 (-) comp15941_c0_seq1:127-1098(-)
MCYSPTKAPQVARGLPLCLSLQRAAASALCSQPSSLVPLQRKVPHVCNSHDWQAGALGICAPRACSRATSFVRSWHASPHCRDRAVLLRPSPLRLGPCYWHRRGDAALYPAGGVCAAFSSVVTAGRHIVRSHQPWREGFDHCVGRHPEWHELPVLYIRRGVLRGYDSDQVPEERAHLLQAAGLLPRCLPGRRDISPAARRGRHALPHQGACLAPCRPAPAAAGRPATRPGATAAGPAGGRAGLADAGHRQRGPGVRSPQQLAHRTCLGGYSGCCSHRTDAAIGALAFHSNMVPAVDSKLRCRLDNHHGPSRRASARCKIARPS